MIQLVHIRKHFLNQIIKIKKNKFKNRQSLKYSRIKKVKIKINQLEISKYKIKIHKNRKYKGDDISSDSFGGLGSGGNFEALTNKGGVF